MYIQLPQIYEKIGKYKQYWKVYIGIYSLNNSILVNIGKESQTNENGYFIIHNHEVPSSILGLATQIKEAFTDNSKRLCFFICTQFAHISKVSWLIGFVICVPHSVSVTLSCVGIVSVFLKVKQAKDMQWKL